VLASQTSSVDAKLTISSKCGHEVGIDLKRQFQSHLFRESNSCIRCGVTKQELAKIAARARSAKNGRVDSTGRMNFALIKGQDFDVKTGARIDALTAAKRLLDVEFWPLWMNTPGRIVVDAGDRVCIYLSGSSTVIATANIKKVQTWTRHFGLEYPLILGGTPELVLSLSDISYLADPVKASDCVNELDCVGSNKRKWGVAFCGGMRTLTPHDFKLLTSAS